MRNNPKVRFAVPAAMAILLTFGRNGMLPFEGYYSLLDHLLNLFVVIIAPIFAFKDIIYPCPINRNIHLLIPLFFLIIWVCICVVFGSPREYWPNRTVIITITLSILMASQISSFELRRVRHCVLLLTGIFCLYTIIFGQYSLNLIFSGALEYRLGSEFSNANLIILPRVMYMLIVTCIISVIIDENKWIKIIAATLPILPLLIAFGTGGRGPLVGAVAAMLFFIFFMFGKTRRTVIVLITTVTMIFIGYYLIGKYFPLMQQRILEGDDSNRFSIWSNLIDTNNLSLFGLGLQDNYPHNIFLEMIFVYGLVGFCIFLLVLAISLKTAYDYYRTSEDLESLWAMSLIVLQITAQQFSLDIFYGSLWAAIVFPIGYGWSYLRTRNIFFSFNFK